MRRLLWSLSPLLAAAAFGLAPGSARADLQLAGGSSGSETPERKGMYLGVGVRPGAVLVPRGFVPALGFDWQLGGGITDRFTLGVDIGLMTYMGMKKLGGGADLVATGFVGKGFFLRGGVGVAANVPALAPRPQRSAVGGRVGMGYEWRVARGLGVGLGLDYDARMRNDHILVQTVLVGLQFRGYFRGRH